MKNPKVRQALAVATDVDGWIKAGGGDKAVRPGRVDRQPGRVGYQDNPAFAGSTRG